MQKYGFREGQGLGKHEQGLSTALSVEKTSKRGGKIIVGDATEKGNFSCASKFVKKKKNKKINWGNNSSGSVGAPGFLFAICPSRKY